ncbi:hypothetical protein SA496_22235 [Pseudomonas sp. JS3066]|uniref:hypothetical protein n=1 Tax=Pseudomonas sp. JS3066 TaxID=3090665 RepID=UPI002E7B4F53|nr:hypothetical protein [Pseudomonas sp. JS3066]WVK92403.1 hypothetical protein SA496_22235 [Pseudomonas sp. JS3066]
MSKHSKSIPNSGAAPASKAARKPGPTIGSPTSIKPERMSDPKTVPREETRRTKPQDADKATAKASAKEPPRAAKGDDDLMSEEPRNS